MTRKSQADGAVCARCGEPAKGYATIGNERYCHADPQPTCYMRESWERTGRTTRTQNEPLDQVRG